MDNSLLIIFVTPKTGLPTQIFVHFYPDMNNSKSKIDGFENENLWIIAVPYSIMELDDAPKLFKKLINTDPPLK